jgi:hypothetical protein
MSSGREEEDKEKPSPLARQFTTVKEEEEYIEKQMGKHVSSVDHLYAWEDWSFSSSLRSSLPRMPHIEAPRGESWNDLRLHKKVF